MRNLIVGRNSSVGISLEHSTLFDDSVSIGSSELEQIISLDQGLKEFLEREEITSVFYLLVDRNDPVTGQTSKYNYDYPIRLWDTIRGIAGVSFVWVCSIFANDQQMLSRHPFLVSQNLAHHRIANSPSSTGALYSRVLFSQIYGSLDFAKHQPFLYHLDSTVRNGLDICLKNGGSTRRNFLYIDDVCRVLADHRSWLGAPSVACVLHESSTWLEITESFKQHYQSSSQINDLVDVKLMDARGYRSQGIRNLADSYDLREINSVILSGDFK